MFSPDHWDLLHPHLYCLSNSFVQFFLRIFSSKSLKEGKEGSYTTCVFVGTEQNTDSSEWATVMTSFLSYLWIKADVFVGQDVVYLGPRKLQTQMVVWHRVVLMLCVFCMSMPHFFSIPHMVTWAVFQFLSTYIIIHGPTGQNLRLIFFIAVSCQTSGSSHMGLQGTTVLQNVRHPRIQVQKQRNKIYCVRLVSLIVMLCITLLFSVFQVLLSSL